MYFNLEYIIWYILRKVNSFFDFINNREGFMPTNKENIMKDNDIIEAEFREEGENLPSTEVKFTQVDAEFEYARGNILQIIETSRSVLENTAELALESDQPRMVEVYSGLIKNLVEINKSLFEIREKKMRIKGELQDIEEIPQGNTINNNAIFVGSTEELMQVMNKGTI
jgi:hypothetical protein